MSDEQDTTPIDFVFRAGAVIAVAVIVAVSLKWIIEGVTP